MPAVEKTRLEGLDGRDPLNRFDCSCCSSNPGIGREMIVVRTMSGSLLRTNRVWLDGLTALTPGDPRSSTVGSSTSSGSSACLGWNRG